MSAWILFQTGCRRARHYNNCPGRSADTGRIAGMWDGIFGKELLGLELLIARSVCI